MARYLYKDSIVIILQYILTGITIQSEYVTYSSILHSVNDIKFNLNYNTGELSIRSQNEIQRAARVACARRSRSYNTRSTLQLARRAGRARLARTKPSIAIDRAPAGRWAALAHGAASGRDARVRLVEGGASGRERRLLRLRRAEVVLRLGSW